LDVSQSRRIGWRNYFIYDFSQESKSKDYFDNLCYFSKHKGYFSKSETSFELENELKATLRIQQVTKKSDETKGVLFDIDVYKEGKYEISTLSSQLKDIVDYLRKDEGFLALVNSTFSKNV